jgi:hypothetical protein
VFKIQINLINLSIAFVVCLNVLQYFLPFASEGINKHIEEAILRADKLGVKVISLAALNKVGTYMFIIVLF